MWYGLFILLRMAALVYVGLLLVLVGCQRSMIYYPTQATESQAQELAATDGMKPWRNDEGEIIGWRPERELKGADVMLVFHGNAGYAAQRGYFNQGFSPNIAIYIMEYPGYGTREGRPSEKTFYAAGEEAMKQLGEERSGRLFLGGESLGTGVACYLASAHPERVSGLFLSTPFTTLVDVARSHYPIFPVGLLMRDRYESTEHLKTYDGPVAMLIAGRDEVVPARFGKQLYEEYHGPKQIWLQEERSHNTLNYSPASDWWSEVVTFLQSHARE